MSNIPNREQAFELLKEYNQSESLIKHALSVEAVMRHFAAIYGEDAEKWGIIGLVHDLDYEKFPEQHCNKTKEILEAKSWPEDYIRAIMSHGWGICTDAKPETNLEKVLYTIDELTGLITATALMRPSKSILDMELKSVKKKWKQTNFAAGVRRDLIEGGAEILGKTIDEVITECILAMRKVAEEIGLKGDI